MMHGSWTSYRLIAPWDHGMVIVFHVEGDTVTIRYFCDGKESPQWRWTDIMVTPDRRFDREGARHLWKSIVAHGWENR
jgi:hypothetical protein